MMNQQATEQPQTDRPNEPLISAKAVATALSSAALVCLVAGVAAIQYLGGVSGESLRETDPEPVAEAPPQPRDRPTVLPRMSPSTATTTDALNGYESFFPPAAMANPSGDAAPRPGDSTARLGASDPWR